MNENEEILLQEYAEGTLDERYRADVEALLARSPSARAHLAELQNLFVAFAALPPEPLAVDLSARVVELLDQEEAAAPLSRFWWLLALQLTAVLLMGIIAYNRWWPSWADVIRTWPTGWQPYLPRWDWAGLVAVLQNSWQTAVADLPALPPLELSPTAWSWLLAAAFLLWLAGNRLLFTDRQNGGGTHG